MEAFSAAISKIFYPLLSPVFHPINGLLSPIPSLFWRLSAIGLFTCTILWVFFLLKKEYVNLDAPGKSLYFDLRVWTVIAMLPHVIIYWVWGSPPGGN